MSTMSDCFGWAEILQLWNKKVWLYSWPVRGCFGLVEGSSARMNRWPYRSQKTRHNKHPRTNGHSEAVGVALPLQLVFGRATSPAVSFVLLQLPSGLCLKLPCKTGWPLSRDLDGEKEGCLIQHLSPRTWQECSYVRPWDALVYCLCIYLVNHQQEPQGCHRVSLEEIWRG